MSLSCFAPKGLFLCAHIERGKRHFDSVCLSIKPPPFSPFHSIFYARETNTPPFNFRATQSSFGVYTVQWSSRRRRSVSMAAKTIWYSMDVIVRSGLVQWSDGSSVSLVCVKPLVAFAASRKRERGMVGRTEVVNVVTIQGWPFSYCF